jgi:hypothetical protein
MMDKLFALFAGTALLGLTTAPVQAQDVLWGKRNGIRAGYQLAQVYAGDDQVDGDLDAFYVGYARGITIGAGILSLNTGVEYQQNGHRADAGNLRRIQYLGIPVGLRVKLGPVFAQAGLNGLVRIAETYLVNGTDVLDDDNASDFVDAVAHVGAGFRILAVSLEARYHSGLTTGANGNRNRYWQFGAGLAF